MAARPTRTVEAGLRRRDVLYGVGAAGLAAGLPRPAFAAIGRDPRLILVILRGGLDGLSAVRPLGDPAYRDARGILADDVNGLPLDGFFALHPSLPWLYDRYVAGEALLVHAVATPYRGRSHDEAQIALESGAPPSDTGWLNRAAHETGRAGILLGVGTPRSLSLRGPAPAVICGSEAARLAGSEELVRAVLGRGVAQGPMAITAPGFARSDPGGGRLEKEAARATATLLAAPDGPRFAALYLDGFDSHARQTGPTSRLARRLFALDGVLSVLADGLAGVWSDTAILVASEFGRSVAANGAQGTEHGLATAAVLIGGGIQGGRVLARWPGLAPERLQDGGLAATTDLRAVLKGVLRDHAGLSGAAIEARVIPGSEDVPPAAGLIR